jgi:hypothetical protein
MALLAYADPPYIASRSMAKQHYSDDPMASDVDHKSLIKQLQSYDGWALSMAANLKSMREIVPMLPENARIASWCKPFASFKPGINPAYTWEAVAYQSARPNRRDIATVKDHLVENITLQKGLVGAKPRNFCWWLFDLLGAEQDDTLHDLYPGTGVVSECWYEFNSQGSLFEAVPA